MHRASWLFILVALTSLPIATVTGQPKVLRYQHSDEYEVVLSRDGKSIDTMFAIGNVIFETDSGMIYCDSAIWAVGRNLVLRGQVIIDDASYHLVADSVRYEEKTNIATARGSYVELLSRKDSVFAVGTHVVYHRESQQFSMEERPTVYLKYPDSAAMIEVVADRVDFDAVSGLAEADGNVKIDSKEISASSGCAVLQLRKNVLDLFDKPAVQRGYSVVRGGLISVISEKDVLKRIDILDSANGDFKEPVNGDTTEFDNSILTGKRIIMDFDQGVLASITSIGQAYSWYYPAAKGKREGKREEQQNSVSGDTIRIAVEEERLRTVTITGGGIGKFLDTKITKEDDSTFAKQTDTVDYTGSRIVYDLSDSTISLLHNATVNSGTVALSAYQIGFQTRHRLVKAYSATVAKDSAVVDSTLLTRFQPNPIPVILKDKDEELYGDFLEYSIETQKGRIVQSKSAYETGLYYGRKVARADKETFYVEDGRYTTCDADEPHFHFYARNMKLMNNNKLLARPVVMHIGRIPILALPYYVFPLKKGRRSGILPFRVGNFEQGNRYIENVGYYWAASDYWDIQNGLSYRERNNSLTLTSTFRYVARYRFDGFVTANISKETRFDETNATEVGTTRWTLNAKHTQQFAGGLKIDATGSYQSDASYYTDYSTDFKDRTNRNVRSTVNFSKRFSKSVSLSGSFSHEENLDAKNRTDRLPTLGISVPVIKPFGSGKIDDQGRLAARWYNNLTISYRPSLINFSSRVTKDSIYIISVDTVGDSVFTLKDTLSYRSRKKYTRLDHSASVNFPLKVGEYVIFNPNFNYSESWFKIYRTDQSADKKIDAGGMYRTYTYSSGASLSTTIYGTVHPMLFGLLGLRQVLTPSFSYGFTPKIDLHPTERAFAGTSTGSSARSSRISAGFGQVYQAKIREGESERNLDLISLQSSLSYDFENTQRPFTSLSTSFQSQLLPRISLSGSMVHSLYKPGTDTLDFWSPFLESFDLLASVTIAGSRFLFDEPTRIDRGADSASQVSSSKSTQTKVGGRQGWSLRVDYSYGEDHPYNAAQRTVGFRKSSSVSLALQFELTQNTAVTFRQAYNPVEGRTVYSQIGVVRKLHCWTGEFNWVPAGGARGYSFRLFVTAIPEIKLDNSKTLVSSSLLQSTN